MIDKDTQRIREMIDAAESAYKAHKATPPLRDDESTAQDSDWYMYADPKRDVDRINSVPWVRHDATAQRRKPLLDRILESNWLDVVMVVLILLVLTGFGLQAIYGTAP